MAAPRPSVSVIVPFAGDPAEAAGIVGELERLERQPGDELIVADNSAGAVVAARPPVRVVRADRIASSYYARNRGARAASGEWLLFVDSDCLLPPSLLDSYFAESPAAEDGIVAGEIDADPSQDALVPRYLRSRRHLNASGSLARGPTPAVATANMLVRREAWEELDGFREVVSGADYEFSWRAGEAGWRVAYRPSARVLHHHPESLGLMRRKARRYGAGQRWLDRLYPGVPAAPGLVREVARAAAGVCVWTIGGQRERAAFKALDALSTEAYARGWRFGDNTAPALPGR